MRYVGGDCAQSVNQNNRFTCEDLLSGGPATSSPVFIEAISSSSGETYFSGAVEAGGVFEMTNNGDPLDPIVTISISDEAMQTPLQVVSFDSSGSTPLLMNDIYGSSQVVGWITAEGVVDSTMVQTLTYEYTISNEGTVPANLQVLVSNFTEGDFFSSQEINLGGTVVQVGQSLPPLSIAIMGVPLDEGRMLFVVESQVFALNDQASQCTVTDEVLTFFGYILPGQELPVPP